MIASMPWRGRKGDHSREFSLSSSIFSPTPVISTLRRLTEIGSTYEISISTKLSAIKPMEEKFDVKLDSHALQMGKI